MEVSIGGLRRKSVRKMHPDMPLKHVPVPGSTSPLLGFSLLLQRGQKFETS